MAFKFENLEIWKLARLLVSEVYAISRKFPKEEIFGLTNQVRRAAVSVVLNIAEGSSKGSDPEFRRFLKIAKGSLDEVISGLFIACDQGFIKNGELNYFYKMANILGAKITALIKKIQ